MRRIAEIAGGRWPESVDQMALQDREQADLDREDGLMRERPHVLLLRHLIEVWPDGEEFVPTEQLVDLLVSEHPEAWGSDGPIGRPLTVQRFGRMLATAYKINSTRLSRLEPRGHLRNTIAGVWSRMQPHPLKEPAHLAQPAQPAQSGDVADAINGWAAEFAPDAPVTPDAPVSQDPPALIPGSDHICAQCHKPNLLTAESRRIGVCTVCRHNENGKDR